MRNIKFRFIFINGSFIAKRFATLDEILDDSFPLEKMEEDINAESGNYDIEDFPEYEVIKNEYVGITNKDDVEIYEGDICIYTNQKGQHVGVVKWINTLNAFRLVFVDREEFFFISEDNKVIDNIYENPELSEKS